MECNYSNRGVHTVKVRKCKSMRALKHHLPKAEVLDCISIRTSLRHVTLMHNI